MNNAQLACLELDTVTGEVMPIKFDESNATIGFSKSLSKMLQYGNLDALNNFIKRHKLNDVTRDHLYATWNVIQQIKKC